MKTEMNEQEHAELLHQTLQLKRTLKHLSKNQLIAVVLQQVNLVVEQQNINKVLLERIKETENKAIAANKEEIKNENA